MADYNTPAMAPGSEYPSGEKERAQEHFSQQTPPAQQQYPPQPQYQQPQHQQTVVTPIPGLPVRGPTVTPAPGNVIIGYQVVQPQESCSCDLKIEGWLVVLILLLVFPCVACIPCCMPDCFQSYQVPVYGPPGSTMQPIPVAQPVYNV